MKYLKPYFESKQDTIDEMEIKLWSVSFDEMETLAKWEIEEINDSDKTTRGGAKGYPRVHVSRHCICNMGNTWYDHYKGQYLYPSQYGQRNEGALLEILDTTSKAWWDVSFIFDPGSGHTKTTISDIVEEYGNNLDQFADHLNLSFNATPKSIQYTPYGINDYMLNDWMSSRDILNKYKDNYVVGIKFRIQF